MRGAEVDVGLWLVALLGCSGGPPEHVPDVPFEQLGPQAGWVRVRGTAHYATTLTEEIPASLLDEAHTRYLFGLFAEGDTRSRGVTVLVRTDRRPEDLVDYEDLVVEGSVVPRGEAHLPPRVADLLAEGPSYGLAKDALVIEAVRVEGDRRPAAGAAPTP